MVGLIFTFFELQHSFFHLIWLDWCSLFTQSSDVLVLCPLISYLLVIRWNRWLNRLISLNTGFEAIWSTAWLSQYSFICWVSQNFNSWRRSLIQISSQVDDEYPFSFYTRSSKQHFYFSLPWNNISTYRYTIPYSGTSINWWSCPICITVPGNLCVPFIIIQ